LVLIELIETALNSYVEYLLWVPINKISRVPITFTLPSTLHSLIYYVGDEQEQMVESVLKGLGFEPEDSDRLCSSFSGGWQMRIGLARLLLSKPSLLLL
jgi:ABC-type dipeptide/oligopeptide/nickel transport system ATPase subunit